MKNSQDFSQTQKSKKPMASIPYTQDHDIFEVNDIVYQI